MLIGLDDVIEKVGGRFAPKLTAKALIPYALTVVPTLPVLVPATGNIQVPFDSCNYSAGRYGMLGRAMTFADQTETTALSTVMVFLETASGQNYMNAPVHVRTLMGTGQNPATIYEPMVLPAADRLLGTFSHNSAGGGLVSFKPYIEGVMFSNKNVPWIERMWSDAFDRQAAVAPFWLTTDQPVVLAPLGTTTVDIHVGFNLELFSATAVSDGAFEFDISDVKNNEQMMNGKITNTTGLGDARYPTEFFTPYLVPEGSRLRLRITDISGGPNTIYITMQGRKVNIPLTNYEALISELRNVYPVPPFSSDPMRETKVVGA